MESKKFFNVFKEFSWIGIGQIITIIGALFGVRILTSFLSPDQYGELALGMTVGTCIYTIFLGPISNGISRYYSLANRKNDTLNYLKAIKKIIFLICLLIFILFIISLLIYVSTGYSKWLWFLIASLIFGLFSSFSDIFNGIQNSTRNRSVVAFYKSLSTWLRFILAAIFMSFFGISSTSAMFGQASSMVLIFILQLYFFKYQLKKKEYLKPLNKKSQLAWQSLISSFSWPYTSWAVLSWLSKSADKWGLELFSGNEAVGFFAILYQLGFYPMSLIIALITSYLTPIYYDQAGDGKNKLKLRNLYSFGFRTFYIIFLILLIPVIISFNYHEIIFKLFVDLQYHSVSYLLGPMMLSALINQSTNLISLLIAANNNIKSLIIPNNVSHFLGIIAYFLGAYYGGLNGIIIASLINSSLFLIWYIILVNRQNKRIII